jgi:hypothetical protein
MELNIRVKIPALDTQRTNQAFTDYRRRNIKRSQEILLDGIHQELINRNMLVEGQLYESWQAEDLEDTIDVTSVSVGSDDIAARVAEYGANEASSGFVNIGEILNWIEKKGIVPDYGTKESFAFAIARKIGEQGQPLHGGLKRPFNAAQKKAKRRIEKIWEDDLDKLVDDLGKV